AHVGQVLIEAAAIARWQRPLQRRRFADDRVEQAERLVAAQPAFLIGIAVAEQALEDDLRIVLHRQRRVRPLPGDGVAVRAAQAVAAVHARLLDHQLERGERRLLAYLLRDDLVNGDAELGLGAGLGETTAEERGGRSIVVGGRAAAVSQRALEVADDGDL